MPPHRPSQKRGGAGGRRRFQFSLRSVFWLTALVAVLCVAVEAYRKYEWDRFIEKLIEAVNHRTYPDSHAPDMTFQRAPATQS